MNSRRIRRVDPILFGGSQQRGLRPGTLPTHQIVGMGTALALAHKEMPNEVPRIEALRNRLWSNIEHVPGVFLNGDTERSLCSILNVSVAAVEGESLRYALQSLAVASGSACNSAIDEPSYVLRSLGRSDQLAEASIRFSLGRFTTTDEVDAAGKVFCEAVEYLQAMSGADVAAGFE
jgi:cysteine desulfurase